MDVGAVLQPRSDDAPHARRVLGGRYELGERIATGGMGAVWRGLDTVLHREVAVKILKDEFVDSPGFLDRFRAEARHAASVSHPGVASVFDYGEDQLPSGCVAYLVMEMVTGEPLSMILHRDGAFPVQTALSILIQTAEALQAAHDLGVVHRDVKPGNLLLVGGRTVKVTDFGISVAIDSVPLTEPGQVLGTAQYMAPEQAIGRDVTPASDLYALGVIGYELLVGRPPFTMGSPAAIASAHVHSLPPPLPASVPERVREVLGQCLAKNPDDRPASADSLAAQLREISSDLPAAASPVPDQTEQLDNTAISSAADQGADDALTAIGETADAPTAMMPAERLRAGGPLIDLGPDVRARRRRRSLAIAIPLIASIAIVIVASQRSSTNQAVATSATEGSAAAAVNAAAASAPATVMVSAAALINYSANDVAFLLTSQGLVVEQTTADAPGTPAGLVVAVAPEGDLPAGTIVTLTVSDGDQAASPAAASPTGTPKDGKGNGKGKG